MRGLSLAVFVFGEQTLPWTGLAINNNLLKYYKKLFSSKNRRRLFEIKSTCYKFTNFFIKRLFLLYIFQSRARRAFTKNRETLAIVLTPNKFISFQERFQLRPHSEMEIERARNSNA